MLFRVVSTDIKRPTVLQKNIPHTIIPPLSTWRDYSWQERPWIRAICAIFRFSSAQGTFLQFSSEQLCRSFAYNRRLFLFFCDSKGTLERLLLLKSIFCKICHAVHWDILNGASALISAVICRVVAFCFCNYTYTRLSTLSLTSLPAFFDKNGPYHLIFFLIVTLKIPELLFGEKNIKSVGVSEMLGHQIFLHDDHPSFKAI